MERRYFIVDLPNQNINHALDICIGLNETQRYSLDGSKLYVKTNQNLIEEKQKTFNILNLLNSNFVTEFTYEQILIELLKSEWQTNEEF